MIAGCCRRSAEGDNETKLPGHANARRRPRVCGAEWGGVSMRRSVVLCGVVLCSAGAVGAMGQGPSLSPEAARADAALLISAFSEIHPGYTRYASSEEMAGAAARLMGLAETGPALGAFYLAVQGYLASIRCEHTEAELPEALASARRASMLPVDFELVDGRAIVVGVTPGVSGVSAGYEIVSIDGRAVGEVLAGLRPYVSVDGWTDHTRTTILAGMDDIGLTSFDVLYPLVFGGGERYTLGIVSPSGERRDVVVESVDEPGSLAARGVVDGSGDFGAGSVRWEMFDARTAVLRVGTFVNYRSPVDPDSVFGPVFRAIGASGAERLVVDLRGVGGGSGDVQGSLVRHLIDGPITAGGPARVRAYRFDAYREHLRTWAEGAFDMPADLFTADGDGFYVVDAAVAGGAQTLEPAAEAWRGELVILCGPNNESGATMMLAELREQRSLTLVGEPTGGSAEGCTAGVIAFLTLPNSGIVARLPLVWSRTSAARFVPGMGVTPDVVVEPTVKDVRAGRDPVLGAAVR